MTLPETPNLGDSFKHYFEIVPAFSEALKDEAYRIRHKVYCEDLNYEPLRPDGREIDEHDLFSLHLLMRSIKTGEFVGCTRIIRTQPQNSDQLLPFEVTCAATLNQSIINPAMLARDKIAEVSRLAVVSRYRRRKGEANTAISISQADFGTAEQPRFPFIPLGLYLGTAELARLHGITTLFILTEQRQVNHFSKLGVKLQVIGAPVEHRGERVPAIIDVSGIINDMRNLFHSLYSAIAADIKRNSTNILI